MSLPIARFIEALSQIGLLTPAEIEALKAAQADKLAADADVLARELVEQGKLTRFQAAALYQGRAEALVLGNYLVIDKLGAGGMGQVFRARHRRMDRVVALKVLSKKQLGSAEAVARFQREVKAAARLTHPHIVTAHDADEAAGMHYLVMEYVEGQDLSALVKAGGPLSVRQAVDYVIQAARGLEHAHSQGIIHRDVKPSNLLLDKQGTVKILDMGLARVDNPLAGPDSGEGLTAAGSVMGTVDFMSPEQALDTARADARADIYSLGCTLYYLLTGKKPYDGETAMKKLLAHREQSIPSLAKARPEVSPDLDAVYRKMVAKRPEERYATMREAREALEAVQAGRRPMGIGTAASPVPVAARISELPAEPQARKTGGKQPRSKTRPVVAGAAVVLLLGVAVVVPEILSKGPAEEVSLADAVPKAMAGTNTAQAVKLASELSKPFAAAPVAEPDAANASPEPTAHPMASDNSGLPANQPSPLMPNPPALTASSPMEPTPPAFAPMDPLLADSLLAAADGELASESAPAADVPAVPVNPAVERKAAEWVLGLGGKIEVFVGSRIIKVAQANRLPSEPFTVTLVNLTRVREVNDESLSNLDALSHLATLILTQTSIGSGAGNHIARHASLKGLFVGTTGFGDEGIEQLGPLTRLELFRGNYNLISDRGAQSLALHKTLHSVFLMNVAITDAGLAYLSQLPLEKLHVDGARITDAGLKPLQGCKGLSILSADRTAITDAGLDVIATLPVLRWLSLRDTRITERSVETLAGMKALDTLSLSDPPISQQGCEKLRTLLPKCKIELLPGKPSAVPSGAPAQMVLLDIAKRLAVPSAEELQNAVSLVKDVFGNELAQAKKPEDKSALAEKLLIKAQESRDDPASAYALLDEARRLATDAADARLLTKLSAELGSRFEIDPLAALADDLEKAAQKTHPANAFRAITETALGQVGDALAADDLSLAKRFTDAALMAARKSKDPSVLRSAVDRSKGITAAKQQWDAAEAAKSVLATKPDDPDANLAVGRYLCFVKGDWGGGLECLAKSNDATLKQLAAKSLAVVEEPAAQLDLADAWWDAADKRKGNEKDNLRAAAGYWYGISVDQLTGLVKTRVEKRLAEIGAVVSRKRAAPAVGKSSTRSASGKLTASNGIAIAETLDCTARAYEFEIGRSFDVGKAWTLKAEFSPPNLDAGLHVLVRAVDAQNKASAAGIQINGNNLNSRLFGEEGDDAIPMLLGPETIGTWVSVVFRYESTTKELFFYVNGKLIKQVAAAKTPTAPARLLVGTDGHDVHRFLGQMRNISLGNEDRFTAPVPNVPTPSKASKS